jgi:hypothetical protein
MKEEINPIQDDASTRLHFFQNNKNDLESAFKPSMSPKNVIKAKTATNQHINSKISPIGSKPKATPEIGVSKFNKNPKLEEPVANKQESEFTPSDSTTPKLESVKNENDPSPNERLEYPLPIVERRPPQTKDGEFDFSNVSSETNTDVIARVVKFINDNPTLVEKLPDGSVYYG